MKNHTKIYFLAFGYEKGDFIPSELSGQTAVDINHIECRGMGGDPNGNLDRIENLMAVTREEHIHYGDKKKYLKHIYMSHYSFLVANGVKFDSKYLEDKINACV